MNPNTLGGRIKERRETLGMTQAELAHKTTLRENDIGRHENGRNVPTADALDKYASALDCTIDHLVRGG